MNGFIFYRGPSVLDGAPIVGVATLTSSNIKTGPKGKGNMVQTWILRADMSPIDASKTGDDSAICGACPHRHSLGGACYVNIGQAPLGIYRAFQRGAYPDYSDLDNRGHTLKVADALAGRGVRLGAYGDPAAMWTGYTHQARHPNFDKGLLRYCMASADTPKQAQKLRDTGARTFRVKSAGAPLMSGEILCLSDSKGIKCIDCGLCDGANRSAASIAIDVHGSRSSRFDASLGHAQLIARA
jgi:hypothetical protein